MKKLTKLSLFSIMILMAAACSSVKFNRDVAVCPYGMSSSDNQNENPLFDALSGGMSAIEVELTLKDGELYVVGGDKFSSQYLEPLKSIAKEGKIYSKCCRPLVLSVNIESQEMADAANKLLSEYKELVSSFDVDGYHPAAVKVVGGSLEMVKGYDQRYLFAVAQPGATSLDVPASMVYMVKINWSDVSQWSGEGEMPIADELKLKTLVAEADRKDRAVSVVGAAPSVALWAKLVECGVDYIATSDIKSMSKLTCTSCKCAAVESAKASLKASESGVDILFGDKKMLGGGSHSLAGSSVKGVNLSDNIIAIESEAAASGEQSIFFSAIPELKEGIAAYLFGDWESWTKPILFSSTADFPKEKVEFALMRYSDGTYGVMVPLCSDTYIAQLASGDGGVGAISRSNIDGSATSVPFMVVGFGSDPYKLVDDVYGELMSYMGRESNLRRNKDYPEAFEHLTWCTWNAMYEDVSEQKIANAIKTFSDRGIHISTLLIDDGWLDISDSRRLLSYEFDKKKFPKGAKAVFDNLKENYGVKSIGVWHTMNGYWAGVDPEGKIYAEHKDLLLEYRDGETVHDTEFYKDPFYAPSPEGDKAYQFYSKWYDYLKEQGISFVKVDQQSIIKRLSEGQVGTSLAFGEVARSMERSLQRAVREHFDGQIINCQDMATEAIYNMGGSAIIRNSDDYFPEVFNYYDYETERGNAAAHLIMNLHNALYISQIAWPDYDMFQSHHIHAAYHAAQRAISGGPLFLTDIPGEQSVDIIKPITLSSGEIIRADYPARPTEDCLFNVHSGAPLKAFSQIGDAGLLGIWNITEKGAEGSWTLADVRGLKGDNYIAYEHNSGKILNIDRSSKVDINLGLMGFEYWNLIPVKSGCAVVGIVDKLNAAGTILSSVVREGEIALKLRECGKLLVVLPTAPKSVEVDGQQVEGYKYDAETKSLSIDIESEFAQVNIK